MHVVITGGTGLIGGALAEALAADGREVTVLTRDPARASALPPTARAAAWDARSIEPLLPYVAAADAIVHLAGENIAGGRWTASRKRRILDSRLSSGASLAAAVEQSERRPAVVVQASAVGYYGPRGDDPVTEQSPAGNDYLARVAAQWEQSTIGVERAGVRRAIARTGVVLAAGGGALARMLPLFRLGVAGPLAGGKQWFPWIHIADEVAALRFLLDTDSAAGAYNLTAPNPVTNAEFTAALGRVLRRPARAPVPAAALRLAFGEMATVLTDGQRAVPERLTEGGFSFRFTDVEAALRDLLA